MDNDGFFSVEKLVEFGLSMAMARQMVGMFNQVMTPLSMPTSPNYMPMNTVMQYPSEQTIYVGVDGKPVGPLREYNIIELYRAKKITKDSLAWIPGMSGWARIEEIPTILRIIALTPPEYPIENY